jgi:hypothetical protein
MMPVRRQKNINFQIRPSPTFLALNQTRARVMADWLVGKPFLPLPIITILELEDCARFVHAN